VTDGAASPSEPPGARAMRALVDAIDRPAPSADDGDDGIPVAGTVVVVRDGARGPEVLMIERPDRGSFAGAWVFPGGKLEPADAVPDAGEEDDARRAAAREAREETGLALPETSLVVLSCWEPPRDIPLRIRTWFYLAPAPASHGALMLSEGEAVGAAWIRPEDVLDRHASGELTLYPPTWVTLHSLRDLADAAAVIASGGSALRYRTVARGTASGPVLLWQDDAAYAPGTSLDAAGPRHRLIAGGLPWRYERSA